MVAVGRPGVRARCLRAASWWLFALAYFLGAAMYPVDRSYLDGFAERDRIRWPAAGDHSL